MSENPTNPDGFNQFSTDWFDPEEVLKAVTEQKQTQMDPLNNLDRITSALREHPDIQDVYLAMLKADEENKPGQEENEENAWLHILLLIRSAVR